MSMTGVQMTHVPYKGVAPIITAQLGGEVQYSFANMFSTMGHWKAERLRLVAHSGLKRMETIPDVPTITESGVAGYDALIWYGYTAAAKTPRAIIQRLHKEITAIVNLPEVRKTFIEQVTEPIANTPEQFAAVINADAEKWGAIGKRLGVRLD